MTTKKTPRNTKNEVVELLLKMRNNCHAMRRMFEADGDERAAQLETAEACAYGTAADLLRDPEYFGKLWAIYNRNGREEG